MTAVASATTIFAHPALEQRSSPLRRTESYIFCSPKNVKSTILDTPLGRDVLVAPYYVCRWNNTGATVPPPPSIPPPPLPASLPPSPPSSPSPSPPPTKSAPLKSILKPPARNTRQRDATSVINYTPKILSPPYPPPCPISVPYGSYVCFDPPEDPERSIQILAGSTVTHLARRFLVTKEYLATLTGLSQSAPQISTKYKQNGICVRISDCITGPPFPLPDMAEAMRLSATRDPISVDIPCEIREVDENINKNETSFTIPTTCQLTVVLHGMMFIVPVAALRKVDLGYSKVPVESRQGYLKGLGVRGEKRKWDDPLGELGELEVVRDKENFSLSIDRESNRKRVRYWADGIDENQVAKGSMKSRKTIERLKRKEAEKKEEGIKLQLVLFLTSFCSRLRLVFDIVLKLSQ